MQSPTLFASIGTRFAMDRLLNAVNDVSIKHPDYNITAQIGETNFQSQGIKTIKWMEAQEFEEYVNACDIFISHAGMGNILLAAHLKKPIIVMPRRFEFNEHTNNHQLSTAKEMQKRSFVTVVNDTSELDQAIVSVLKLPITSKSDNALNSRSNLINTLKDFIENEKR